MAIIGLTNLKGGTGKSTIAQSLAAFFLGEGFPTLLIDADPQGTCLAWAERAAEAGLTIPQVHALGQGKGAGEQKAMLVELQALARSKDFPVVVVDCPPRLGGATMATMRTATVLLMPVAASPADAWALEETLNQLEIAQAYNPEVVARALLNRVDRTAIGRDIAAQFKEAGIDVCENVVKDRVVFKEAMLHGKTALTAEPESETAHALRRLGKEVMAMAKLTKPTKPGKGDGSK